jgi:hypothetical protein
MTLISSDSDDQNRPLTLHDVCTAAQRLFREVRQNRDVQFPIRVNDWLLPEISRKAGLDCAYRVEFPPTPPPIAHPHLLGLIWRYKDHAVVHAGQKDCSARRYAVCKELGHLLIDRPSDYTKNPVTLVLKVLNFQPMMAALDATGAKEFLTNDLRSEFMAKCAAYELLMPWCLREELRAMRARGMSTSEISKHIFVPEPQVDKMLSANGYGSISHKVNTEVEAKLKLDDPTAP